MKNTGTLFELIQRLEEFDDSERSYPLVIYAQQGANAERKSPALVCPRNEEGGRICPLDSSLSVVVSVQQTSEAIDIWSSWRRGLTPSPEERFRTVMFFALHGAFLPLESDREGM